MTVVILKYYYENKMQLKTYCFHLTLNILLKQFLGQVYYYQRRPLQAGIRLPTVVQLRDVREAARSSLHDHIVYTITKTSNIYENT